MRVSNWFRALCACGLLTGNVASEVAVAGGAAVAPGRPAEQLVTEIKRLIGAAACSSDADCRVIGVGARACGGPEGYWAWSATETDAQRLSDAVQRQAVARREELERSGMLSTCQILAEPRVACRPVPDSARGRCTTLDHTRGD